MSFPKARRRLAVTALTVLAPVAGRAMPLAEVPDPVFSAALVGPGVAVDPPRDKPAVAVSPVAGKIVKLHPHAYVVQTADGVAEERTRRVEIKLR